MCMHTQEQCIHKSQQSDESNPLHHWPAGLLPVQNQQSEASIPHPTKYYLISHHGGSPVSQTHDAGTPNP
uniref:Uncharacterized protein n=1 Tax=Rhizophora mucronata TaxID=61149 RepID=A0A2P2M5X9_RHIMU